MKAIFRNILLFVPVVVWSGLAGAISINSTMSTPMARTDAITTPVISPDVRANAETAYSWKNVDKTVGPTAKKSMPQAYLKVYSEAHPYFDGDIQRVNRVPYSIYSADGKLVKWVAWNDTDPKLITLPPGKYVIVPQTWRTKTQIIGANLEDGQLTEVHFKGENPV